MLNNIFTSFINWSCIIQYYYSLFNEIEKADLFLNLRKLNLHRSSTQ